MTTFFLARCFLLAALLSSCLAAAETTDDAERAPAGPPLVLVAGASGQTGRLVLERAANAGYQVRAMSRDTARSKAEIPGRYEWVTGDVRDVSTLAAAMDGARYLICAIGATERSGPNSPEFVDYGGVRNLVDAARAAGVSHFVLVSSTGAGGGGGAFAWLLNTVLMPGVLDWKGKGEAYLRASGLTYTILRPGGLTNDPGAQSGIRFTQGDTLGGGTITRADVATLAVFALGNADAADKTLEMASDAAAPVDAWKKRLAELKAD